MPAMDESVEPIPPAEPAGDALSDSSAKYKALFDAIDEGFCIVEVRFDENGKAEDYLFVEANPAFEKQTGIVGAVGRTMRELRPNHEAHWFQIYGDIARTGQPARFQARAAALNRFYDVYAFRVGEPGQNRVAVLFNDIGPRKRAEEALQEASRRKDEFLAILAHELRNPLAPIRNGLQIVRLASQGDSTLRRTVDMMERQLTHLIRLVDDLLDVGRIESGKIALQREPVSLCDVLAASIESIQALIDSRHHRLVVTTGDEELYVDGDFDRLAQIFSNLLSNAAKYTDPAGRITVIAQREGEQATVQVSDTGMGIPAEDIAHVFELFSQGAMHRAHAEGGLGIGLALVRRLVELHGGTVAVESQGIGTGSTFIVRLPITQRHQTEGDERRNDPAEARREQAASRILVVDDNVDAADSLAILLRIQGHDVEVANGGVEAIEKAARFKPDIVFLDIGMPDVDGIETAHRLRAMPEGARSRLIALTGWGQAAERQRTHAAGFDDHLVKPVDPVRLSEIVQGGGRLAN